MNCTLKTVTRLAIAVALALNADVSDGQQIYFGSTASDLQYPRSQGLDSNGRATAVDARSIDQYGVYTNDFGRAQPAPVVPGHYYGGGYAPGGYYPGDYSGLGYSNGLGYTVGLSGYSGGYQTNYGPINPAVATGNPIYPPRTIVVGGVYPSRTVINNATRGGVYESTHNGNGYVYEAGSSYPTVIESGPNIFPYTSVVQSTQPPVLIEAKRNDVAQVLQNLPRNAKEASEIQLMFPKTASAPLSYMLNGTSYSIKPGYVQKFPDDRVWTIEFLRGGNRSQVMRYQLTAGNYLFDANEDGWDLKRALPAQAPAPAAQPPVPPPPVPAPTPAPDL